MNSRARSLLHCVFALIGGGILFAAGNWERPRHPLGEDLMSVALPVPMQILYSAGDRYLAANIGTWRAIMVGVGRLPPETLSALAQVQEDVSWLNPAHEDNYYTAAAILPWEGKVQQAQVILSRATDARPTDVYPPFYLGFNRVHFLGDVPGGVAAFRTAAAHAQDEGTKQALTVMAARWSEKSDDTELAIRLVRGMAEGTRDKALRDYLNQRAVRLEGLKSLQDAWHRFVALKGHAPENLEALVAEGLLTRIPDDPLGGGYVLSEGRVVMQPPKN